MTIVVQPLSLPLRGEFSTANHSSEQIDTVLVAVRGTVDDSVGLGEAPVNPVYTATAVEVVRELQALRDDPQLSQVDPLSRAWRETLRRHRLSGPARCGLEMAVLDLWGKRRDEPVWRLWGMDPDRAPATSATVGLAAGRAFEEQVAWIREHGFGMVKVKLGAADFEADVARLTAVRSVLPETDLRVDMNASWTLAQLTRALPVLRDVDVQMVEEPLTVGTPLAEYRRLYDSGPWLLVADERLLRHDLTELVGCFHGLNLKQSYLGGPLRTWAAVRRARGVGFEVMLGCNGESSVAISGVAQLAPAVDALDLDSALLLAREPFEGVRFEAGELRLSDAAGLGVRLRSDATPPPLLKEYLNG